MPLVVDDLVGAGEVAADRRNGLGHRAHLEIDDAGHVEVLLDAVAGRAERTHGVRLVDHEPGAVLAAELGGGRQVHDVAIHREDGVGDHEDRVVLALRLGKMLLQVAHVVVAIRLPLRPGQQASVHDRRVVELVHEDEVSRAE